MTNRNKIALLISLCAWPAPLTLCSLVLIDKGCSKLLFAVIYLVFFAIVIVIGKWLFKEKNIKQFKGQVTPIFDMTLKGCGFRYNAQHDRWQIGCIGAPCFIYYNSASSDSLPNMIECFNYVSGNDEHLVRLVHSIEEIHLVLNACGITEGMIEKAQDVWRQ